MRPAGRTCGLRLESATIAARDVRDLSARFVRSDPGPMPFAMQLGPGREIPPA